MANEQDRQIVVATEQLGLVGQKIENWLEKATHENAQLGLTLLTFINDESVAAAARALTAERKALVPEVPAPTTYSDLDIVLGELRLIYKHHHDGWTPTLGKNRTLNGVQFKPYTHSYDKPTPVAANRAFGEELVGLQGDRVPVGLFDTRLAANSHFAGTYVADADALLQPVLPGGKRQWWEGHATFIAGIIRRYAPSTVLDVRTALRSQPADNGKDGPEEWTVSLWDFAKRLAEYQTAGVSVLNLSLGVATEDGVPPLVLERAIAQLTPSVVVIAAAGNHGSDEVTADERKKIGMPLKRNAPLYPAALDNVIAVGALDVDGRPAAFNPRGAKGAGDDEFTGFAPWIDLWADGVNVVSTYLGEDREEKIRVEDRDGVGEDKTFSGWAAWSGSSFATARITAEIAKRIAEGATVAGAVQEVRAAFRRPKDVGANAQ